jgi:hypothetical protein
MFWGKKGKGQKKTGSTPSEEKSADKKSQRILTAEGWRRMVLNKTKSE